MERSRLPRCSKEFALSLLEFYTRGMKRKGKKKIYEVMVYL